jgi:hypothetical protein
MQTIPLRGVTRMIGNWLRGLHHKLMPLVLVGAVVLCCTQWLCKNNAAFDKWNINHTCFFYTEIYTILVMLVCNYVHIWMRLSSLWLPAMHGCRPNFRTKASWVLYMLFRVSILSKLRTPYMVCTRFFQHVLGWLCPSSMHRRVN